MNRALRLIGRVAATFVLVTFIAPAAAFAATVSVRIEGAKQAVGTLRVSICDREHFAKVCAISAEAPAQLNASTKIFENVPSGRYAVFVFHDLNGNGKLDFDLLRMTSEPYGVSGVWRLGPTFDKAAFDVGADALTISVSIKAP